MGKLKKTYEKSVFSIKSIVFCDIDIERLSLLRTWSPENVPLQHKISPYFGHQIAQSSENYTRITTKKLKILFISLLQIFIFCMYNIKCKLSRRVYSNHKTRSEQLQKFNWRNVNLFYKEFAIKYHMQQ